MQTRPRECTSATPSGGDLAWWQAPLAGLVDALGSRVTGLTSAEGHRLLKRHGRNALRAGSERPLVLQLLRRFAIPWC